MILRKIDNWLDKQKTITNREEIFNYISFFIIIKVLDWLFKYFK